MLKNDQDAWEKSYRRGDNFVFYPHEEVIRFVSKYIRKRVGLNEFLDAALYMCPPKLLDLGCGIGRHVKYCSEMGVDYYGVDLSEAAVITARKWLSISGVSNPDERIV